MAYSIFINNKYTRTYIAIINNALGRNTEGYIERHHIVPKCMGGSNESSNMASLTAKEHYVVHLLLTKMTTGSARDKMLFAHQMMCNMKTDKQFRYNGNKYAHARKDISKAKSEFFKEYYDSHPNQNLRSEVSKKLWEDPEKREHLTQTRKNYWGKESSRLKQSIAKKDKFKNDPEFVRKHKAIRQTEEFKMNHLKGISQGFYVTPWGTFLSTPHAAKHCPYRVTVNTLHGIFKNVKKVLNKQMIGTGHLKTPEIYNYNLIGRTFVDAGFLFVPKPI